MRYQDQGENLADFLEEILVCCPRCENCARITLAESRDEKYFYIIFAKRRLLCAQCGLMREWKETTFGFNERASLLRDPYFDALLWFQMDCCGNTLWAVDRAHLSAMEQFVQAGLREQKYISDYEHTIHGSLGNVLPRWMKIAKHREDVLACIAKLKRKI